MMRWGDWRIIPPNECDGNVKLKLKLKLQLKFKLKLKFKLNLRLRLYIAALRYSVQQERKTQP